MKTDRQIADQLVLELYVKDLLKAAVFYEDLGFTRGRTEHNFMVLHWDKSPGNHAMIFLEAINNPPPPFSSLPQHVIGNIRILVDDVDKYWELAQSLNAPVLKPLADRSYSLRDFTIISPEGLGLRFGSPKKV